MSRKHIDFVSVMDFGAIGDGSADDTTALTNALATGNDVYIPDDANCKLISNVTMSTAGQRIFGGGQITQATNQSTCLVVTGDDCVVEGLTFAPQEAGTPNSFQGLGIYVNTADRVTVKGITVTGGRKSGVMLYNSNFCHVTNCRFINSDVVPATDNHTAAGSDITVWAADGGTSNGNIISGNHCMSGVGTGIVVQSVSASSSATLDGNVIDSNYISDQPIYGIIVYRSKLAPGDAFSDYLTDTIISNNRVWNISGQVEDATNGLIYGAGIYNQGAEGTVISGNSVRETHMYHPTSAISDTLAPGGIGTTNSRDVTIIGNQIRDCAKYGIYCTDPNSFGKANATLQIIGNSINGNTGHGVYCITLPRYTLQGNDIYDNGSNGVLCVDSTHITVASDETKSISFIGNHVHDNGTTSHTGLNIQPGFSGDNAHDVTISMLGNVIENNGLYGAALGAPAGSSVELFLTCTGNVFRDQVEATNGTGIRCTTPLQGGVVEDNIFDGNKYGIDLGNGAASVWIGERNVFNDSVTADYRYASDQRFQMANGATPSLKNARYAETGGITTITGFTDMQRGVPCQIVVLHSVTILGTAYVSGNIVTVINDFGTYRIVSDNT